MSDDKPLRDDVAELNREAQKAVDRVIAARVELAAALENINTVRGLIEDGSAAAVLFIDNYMNPAVPNPAPIAPDVAADPPPEEPPVFTDVATATLDAATTSGGEAEVIDDAFDVPEPPPPFVADAGEDGGAGGPGDDAGPGDAGEPAADGPGDAGGEDGEPG